MTPRILSLFAVCLWLAACSPKGAESYNEGQRALAQKDYLKARKHFAKAIKQNEKFGEAYYNLGAAEYHLAVKDLRTLVTKVGSAELKKRLADTSPQALAKRVNVPASKARLDPSELDRLKAALSALPESATEPVLRTLQHSFTHKRKAHGIFKQGTWVVVKRPQARKRMLTQLAEIERLRAFLYDTNKGDRGLLLLAIARPTLVPMPTAPKAGGAPK